MRSPIKTFVCLFLVSILISVSSIVAAAEKNANEVIGHVKVLKGDAHIMRDDQRLDLAEGVDVLLNDEAVTGSDGALGLTLSDSTTLSLGPDSSLVLDDFVYDPAEKNLGMDINLLQGTLAYVSGTIAKLSPESVRLITPSATIGIRGTKVLIRTSPK